MRQKIAVNAQTIKYLFFETYIGNIQAATWRSRALIKPRGSLRRSRDLSCEAIYKEPPFEGEREWSASSNNVRQVELGLPHLAKVISAKRLGGLAQLCNLSEKFRTQLRLLSDLCWL
jgi:hypothetical protein